MSIIDRIIGKAVNKQLQDQMTNLLNQILYQYNNNTAYMLPAENQSYINDGYKGNIHVYAVVNSIIKRTTGIRLQHINGEDDILNSELLQALERPNPMQSWDEFVQAWAGWLLLTGNAYFYAMRAEDGLRRGKVIEMYLLPAHIVEIIGGGIMQPVKEYRINLGAGMIHPIPAQDVLHVKYFNPDYSTSGAQLYGQSPLQAAINTLTANNEGYKALSKSYVNGAPAGILTGTDNAAIEYSPEQIELLKKKWKREAGGADNFRNILFSRPPMQWISMGWSPVDMNVLEHLKYTLQDICNIYSVPIHLFASTAAAYNNYKESRKAIYTDAVFPLFDMVIPALSHWLADAYQPGSKLIYSTDGISELNSDIQYLTSSLAPAWWMTGNERRLAMGLPEHDDPMMNEILYPGGVIPGSEMGEDDRNDLTL